MANREFNVKDADVLNAVRYHTTGRPGMSVLEKIILVADYIDPSRPSREDIKAVRTLAETDLNAAVTLVLTEKIAYNKDNALHPRTLEAMKSL